MPFRNLKISFTQGTDRAITTFEIIDENGVTYLFGSNNEIEHTGVTPAADSKIEDKTTKTHNSSWVLTKINNANRTESIDFTYAESSYSTENKYLMTTISDICPSEIQNYSNTTQIKQRLVSSIASSLGKIEFTWLDNRKDMESSTKYLSQIKLSDSGGQSIQTIRLSYSYFSAGCTEKECYRLRLDKIYDRQMTPICTFSYNTVNNLPSRTSVACDYWGYFNNMATSSFPKDMIIERKESNLSQNTPYRYIAGGDRRVSANYTQANILNRIEYRGGSYKTFEYEAHLANLYKESNKEVDSANITYGGARIRSITTFDGSIAQKQLLEYVNEEGSTSGAICTLPKFGILTINSIIARYLTSYPLNELTDYNNVGVGYSRVVETIVNADDNVGGKTICNYSNFDLHNDQILGENIHVDKSMNRGQLLSSTVFDPRGNKIKEDVYTYNFDVPIISSLEWEEVTSMSASCNNGNNFTYHRRPFMFIEKPVHLTGQVATTHRNGLSQSVQTDYEYNSLGQVTSTTQWNTNNPSEKHKAENTYINEIIEETKKNTTGNPCQDTYNGCIAFCERGSTDPVGCRENCDKNLYKCTNDPMREVPSILITLNSRNQINVPIETISSIVKNDNKTVLSAQLNFFENYNAKVFLKNSFAMNEPVTNYQRITAAKSEFKKDPHLRLLSTINSVDDKGNITQQTDKYGITTAYTYDNLSVPAQTTITSNTDTRTSAMTYIPLVGTTSKTDANSLSSYTDYDALWRVKFTKDQNRDIVKRNQYHTSGESIGFFISGNTGGCLSNSFTFEASNIAYARGNPPTFLWEFGDGKFTRTTDASVTHTWTVPDTYNIRVTAFNDVYEPVIQNVSVEVLSDPSFDLTTTESGPCRFTVTSNYKRASGVREWRYMPVDSPNDGALEAISISGNSDSFSLGREDVVTAGYYRVALKITDSCGEATRYTVLNLTCN